MDEREGTLGQRLKTAGFCLYGSLLPEMAHEMGNFLNSINISCQLMELYQQQEGLSQAAPNKIAIISRNIDRIEPFLKRMLHTRSLAPLLKSKQSGETCFLYPTLKKLVQTCKQLNRFDRLELVFAEFPQKQALRVPADLVDFAALVCLVNLQYFSAVGTITISCRAAENGTTRVAFELSPASECRDKYLRLNRQDLHFAGGYVYVSFDLLQSLLAMYGGSLDVAFDEGERAIFTIKFA